MSHKRHNPPPLPADEVHAWAVPLGVSPESSDKSQEPSNSLALDSRLSTLDSHERERATRFTRDDLRRRFVVAHTALRTILGHYLGIEPGEVQFHYGPHGKPRLAEAGSEGHGAGSTERRESSYSLLPAPCSLHFNLAHSGDVAVVAVTRGGEIGVDVERLRQVRRLEQLARRYFTATEAAAIMSVDEPDRDAQFLAVWTAKEAILKAMGTGLSYPLQSFSVSPAVDRQWVRLSRTPRGKADGGGGKEETIGFDADVPPSPFPLPPSRWWLARVDVASGYLAAVATDSQKSLRPTFRYPGDLRGDQSAIIC